jgi:hypothetical protein
MNRNLSLLRTIIQCENIVLRIKSANLKFACFFIVNDIYV